MRFRAGVLILMVLGGCVSCAYDEKRKVETALEKSVDTFHEQLNNEQYHEIYSQSDVSLQNGIREAEFTARLKSAHDQLGTTSGKAIVIIDDSTWRSLHLRGMFGAKRLSFSHVEMTGSDLIIANERFAWAIENDQPRLASYEFRSVCRKPCTVGFALR